MSEVLSYYSLYFVSNTGSLILLVQSIDITEIDNITTKFKNSAELAIRYNLDPNSIFILRKELIGPQDEVLFYKILLILYEQEKKQLMSEIATNSYSINPIEETYYWLRNMSLAELNRLRDNYQLNLIKLKKEKSPN